MDRKLVRRAPADSVVRLGGPFEPLVQPWLGARFGVPAAKERDLMPVRPAPVVDRS